MKRNDIPDIREKLFFQNYEHLFNVYTTEDGDYFYNILKKVNIPSDIDSNYYNTYVVKPGDTWTGLSYNIYDDVKLWWLICIANGVINPLEMPISGTTLKILTADIAQSILMTIRNG